jgi:glycosyltransferase involved in cell wall biosynthesis
VKAASRPDAPRFSVVIPTKDRDEGLRRAVRSALDQSWSDLEVVVIDDGSAVPVADRLGDEARDPRLRILRNEASIGSGPARNVAVEHARGSWLAFLDDDDTFEPTKLARVAAVLDARPEVDVVYHDAWIDMVHEGLSYRNAPDAGPVDYRRMLVKNLIGGPSMVVVRRAAFASVGGFPTIDAQEDWALYLELAREGARFAYLPEALGRYERRTRRPAGRSSGEAEAKSLDVARANRASAVLEARHREALDALPPAMRRARARHQAAFVGYRYLTGYRGREAARWMARAFFADPKPSAVPLLLGAATALLSPRAALVLQGRLKHLPGLRGVGRA